jgi:hypothetical protein
VCVVNCKNNPLIKNGARPHVSFYGHGTQYFKVFRPLRSTDHDDEFWRIVMALSGYWLGERDLCLAG